MNKQENPIFYNSSIEKLIININGTKPLKWESFSLFELLMAFH